MAKKPKVAKKEPTLNDFLPPPPLPARIEKEIVYGGKRLVGGISRLARKVSHKDEIQVPKKVTAKMLKAEMDKLAHYIDVEEKELKALEKLSPPRKPFMSFFKGWRRTLEKERQKVNELKIEAGLKKPKPLKKIPRPQFEVDYIKKSLDKIPKPGDVKKSIDKDLKKTIDSIPTPDLKDMKKILGKVPKPHVGKVKKSLQKATDSTVDLALDVKDEVVDFVSHIDVKDTLQEIQDRVLDVGDKIKDYKKKHPLKDPSSRFFLFGRKKNKKALMEQELQELQEEETRRKTSEFEEEKLPKKKSRKQPSIDEKLAAFKKKKGIKSLEGKEIDFDLGKIKKTIDVPIIKDMEIDIDLSSKKKSKKKVKAKKVEPKLKKKSKFSELEFVKQRLFDARDALADIDLPRARHIYVEIMATYKELPEEQKSKVYDDIHQLYEDRKHAETLFKK